MKPFATLSSILLAGAIAAPAFAATTIDGMNVPVPTPRPHVVMAQATTEPMAPSAAMEQPSTGAGNGGTDMMNTGAITPGVSGVADFKAVDVSKIAVLRVDEISDDAAQEQYRLMSDGKTAEVQKLQSDIRSNPDLVAALQAQQVEVDHVLSVQQNGDGSVTFIVM